MAIDIYEPRRLAAVLRRNPANPTFLRDTIFKNKKTFDTKHVDFDIVKGARKVAPFVNPKVGGEVIPNRGYETKTYTAPMVAPAKNINADDLTDRLPGESLDSKRSPAQRAIEIAGADLKELEGTILRREEVMCAEALFTGKINIKGVNVDEEIDFGFTNAETLSSAKKWTASGSDPLGDLARWKQAIHKTGMTTPNMVIMDTTAAAAFINNEAVQKLLDIKNINIAQINPMQLEAGVSFIGTIPSMGLSVYTYDEWYEDDWTDPTKPVLKPFVPEGTVCLISTHAEFTMLYGAVSVFDKVTHKAHTYIGDRVPISTVSDNALNRTLTMYSRPLPVPHELNSWFVGKVI